MNNEFMANHKKKQLFITGMLRTGTTLLDKLLNSHPGLTVASQPYFNLFLYVKEKYNKNNNYGGMPLPAYLCEPSYLRENLADYLNSLKLSQKDISVLRKIIPKGNHRWSLAIDENRLKNLRPGLFFSLLRTCMEIIEDVYGKPTSVYTGFKEVLCEEFIPCFLGKGYKCIIICRDPRSVISSLSSGRYEGYVGKKRPILMDIRNWRKSVAFAVSLTDHPGFLMIKYEDLVRFPDKELRKITDFLGLNPFDKEILENPIKNQDGSVWKGNSSFNEKKCIDSSSIEKWKQSLSQDEISLIEYCSMGEMAWLGYKFETCPEKTIIDSIYEDRKRIRENYGKEHYLDSLNKKREKERFCYIVKNEPPCLEIAENYFFSQKVWKALHNALA